MAWMSDEQYEYVQDCKEKSITARSARNKKTHTGKGGAVKFPSDYMSKKEREAMNGECKSYRMNDPITWEEFKTWPKEYQETYIKLLRKKFNVPDKNIAEMMGISRPTLCKLIVDLGLGTGKGSSSTKKKDMWDMDGFYAWRGGAKEGVVKASETPVEEDIEDVRETPVEEESSAEEIKEATDEIIVVNEEPEFDIPSADAVYEWAKKEPNYKEQKDDIYTDEHEYNCEKVNAEPNWFHDVKFAEANTVVPCNGEMTFKGNVDDILRTIRNLLDGRQVKLEVEWEVLE